MLVGLPCSPSGQRSCVQSPRQGEVGRRRSSAPGRSLYFSNPILQGEAPGTGSHQVSRHLPTPWGGSNICTSPISQGPENKMAWQKCGPNGEGGREVGDRSSLPYGEGSESNVRKEGLPGGPVTRKLGSPRPQKRRQELSPEKVSLVFDCHWQRQQREDERG